MKSSDFEYNLPKKFIAQTPLEARDASRLLVLDRKSGGIEHAVFRNIGRYLRAGDLLVLNETRVIHARLFGKKVPSCGKVEILLLNAVDSKTWVVLVRGRGLISGRMLTIDGGPGAEIVAELDGAKRLVKFDTPIEPFLSEIGHVPLPPYIKQEISDPERYQTIFARHEGSSAAPTAGLHFTPELIEQLQGAGVLFTSITLHIGLDTFIPVTEEFIVDHKIHTELCSLSEKAAEQINLTHRSGGRIIAVGTTSVRTLESAVQDTDTGDITQPIEGQTDLYIYPGYKFRVVDAMITNFHLPRSTLIMLVSAFAGRRKILDTYKLAMEAGYRFYSFGDAMLIL